MVEKDWHSMVEQTPDMCESGMSVEGFFMNTVIIDKNIPLIPANKLLSFGSRTSDANKTNVCSKTSRQKLKSKSVDKTAKIYGLKELRVYLEKSQIWVDELTNPGDSEGAKVLPTDQEILDFDFGTCPKGKRKGRKADDNECENRKKQKLIQNETFKGKKKTSNKRENPHKDLEISVTGKQKSLPKSVSEEVKPPDNHSQAGRKSKRMQKNAGESEEKLQKSDKDTLQQTFNTFGNCSMILREKRQYYWLFMSSDDENDVSWECSMKRKKRSKNKMKKKNSIGKPEKNQRGKSDKGDDKINKENEMMQSAKNDDDKANVKKTKKAEKEGGMMRNAKKVDDKADVKKTKKAEKKENALMRGKMTTKEITQEKKDKGKAAHSRGKENKEQAKGDKEKRTSGKGQSKAATLTQEVVKKPEDCAVTAKRGTLKYLKQREEYVKAVAKEAESEDDFFASVDFSKKSKITDLLRMDTTDSLVIKTPKSKNQNQAECVITPRTSLLGQWGVTKESNTAYTPSTHSPKEEKSSKDKTAIMETIYHQLKGRGRPRGIRKSQNKENSMSTSVLMNPQKSVIELPAFPEIPEEDEGNSDRDDYFNISDAF